LPRLRGSLVNRVDSASAGTRIAEMRIGAACWQEIAVSEKTMPANLLGGLLP
jgi:hypothetical protein